MTRPIITFFVLFFCVKDRSFSVDPNLSPVTPIYVHYSHRPPVHGPRLLWAVHIPLHPPHVDHHPSSHSRSFRRVSSVDCDAHRLVSTSDETTSPVTHLCLPGLVMCFLKFNILDFLLPFDYLLKPLHWNSCKRWTFLVRPTWHFWSNLL